MTTLLRIIEPWLLKVDSYLKKWSSEVNLAMNDRLYRMSIAQLLILPILIIKNNFIRISHGKLNDASMLMLFFKE